MKFWEVQQRAGSGHWRHIAYCKTLNDAHKVLKEYNTKVEVNAMRVEQRDFWKKGDK